MLIHPRLYAQPFGVFGPSFRCPIGFLENNSICPISYEKLAVAIFRVKLLIDPVASQQMKRRECVSIVESGSRGARLIHDMMGTFLGASDLPAVR
ncbi:hypothetical protein CY652_17260 [Burkholderia sp. WAC0059]|nr:hypothetical protein CY652_17260 [Burkholderia sp. WAC0059]